MANPLKTSFSGDWNGSKLVASPLSVAAIFARPSNSNLMRLFARGHQDAVFIHDTHGQVSQVPGHSALMLVRSACQEILAAASRSFSRCRSAHSRPFLYVTTFNVPG